jgi:hypothetical protein
MAKAEAYKQMVASAPQAFDPKKAILKYSDELGLTGVEETLSPNINQMGQPQQPPVDPAKMADVAAKHAKTQADAQKAADDRQADLLRQQRELADNEQERQNRVAVAQIDQGTERLRLASTVAIHADHLQEVREAANIKLMSDHASAAHDHMNDMEKAEQAHQHSLAESEVAHQRASQTAAVAHERSKDMAEHQAKLAPKPAAKPKKEGSNGKKPSR